MHSDGRVWPVKSSGLAGQNRLVPEHLSPLERWENSAVGPGVFDVLFDFR